MRRPPAAFADGLFDWESGGKEGRHPCRPLGRACFRRPVFFPIVTLESRRVKHAGPSRRVKRRVKHAAPLL